MGQFRTAQAHYIIDVIPMSDPSSFEPKLEDILNNNPEDLFNEIKRLVESPPKQPRPLSAVSEGTTQEEYIVGPTPVLKGKKIRQRNITKGQHVGPVELKIEEMDLDVLLDKFVMWIKKGNDLIM